MSRAGKVLRVLSN